MNLKYRTSLVGARCRKYNFPVDTYDDGDGQLWLFGDDGGLHMIVRATSFESAYGIYIDERPTIAESDVCEAYGFYGDNAELEMRQAVEQAEAGMREYPELEEGYRMQDNCSGTGIVNEGHYMWGREMTREDCDNYRLVVRDWDHDELTHVKFELESYAYTMTVNGKSKSFRSFSLLSDVGERIRRLERVYTTVNVERVWV